MRHTRRFAQPGYESPGVMERMGVFFFDPLNDAA